MSGDQITQGPLCLHCFMNIPRAVQLSTSFITMRRGNKRRRYPGSSEGVNTVTSKPVSSETPALIGFKTGLDPTARCVGFATQGSSVLGDY